MFHHALDRTAFTGCVTTLENNHDALTGFFDPVLQFQQFDLQTVFLFFIRFALHTVFVWVRAFTPFVGQDVIRMALFFQRFFALRHHLTTQDAIHQRFVIRRPCVHNAFHRIVRYGFFVFRCAVGNSVFHHIRHALHLAVCTTLLALIQLEFHLLWQWLLCRRFACCSACRCFCSRLCRCSARWCASGCARSCA